MERASLGSPLLARYVEEWINCDASESSYSLRSSCDFDSQEDDSHYHNRAWKSYVEDHEYVCEELAEALGDYAAGDQNRYPEEQIDCSQNGRFDRLKYCEL